MDAYTHSRRIGDVRRAGAPALRKSGLPGILRRAGIALAAAVAWAYFAAPAAGQLGERREAVEAQLGVPTATDEAAGRARHAWGNGTVVVEYENGGVRAMRWTHPEPMWPDAFKEVLAANGGEAAWTALPPTEARAMGQAFKAWKRADGSTAWIPESDLNALVLRFAGVIQPPPTPKPEPSPSVAPSAPDQAAPAEKPRKSPAFAWNPLYGLAGIAVLLLGLMISKMARKKKAAALRAQRLARRDRDPATLSMDECSWDEFELLVAEMMRQGGRAITICPAGGAEGEAFLASGDSDRIAVSCDHHPGAGPAGEQAVRLALAFQKASGAEKCALAVSRELAPDAAKLAEAEGVRVIPRAEIQAWMDGVIREKGKSPVDFSWWIEGFRRKVQMKGVSCGKCGSGMALGAGAEWKCTKRGCGGKRPGVRLLVESE